MFSALGKNVAAFTGDTSFSHADQQTQVLQMGHPKTQFANLTEAEDSLSNLNSFFDNLVFGKKSPRESLGMIGCMSPIHATTDCFLTALEITRPLFFTWNSRLELSKTSQHAMQLTLQEKRRMALLSLYQTTWSAFVKMDSYHAGLQTHDYGNIFERIEEIMRLDKTPARPLFAFNGHLVCELSTICASCTDAEIRNKAIMLLRSMRRREGVWDSWEVANVYESAFKALEDGRFTLEYLPWGITQISKEVSW
ncbi:hypothetical protein NW762_005568 [Fusarium torreyae]|uniref:Uncharacterized protein n=1 Tax=Fusarium torreyae TaxID=1237075 RepID=A0A9W8S312_9HYPO|nr:hypothetical protein NW762_005568 [Fusarium torreyae]